MQLTLPLILPLLVLFLSSFTYISQAHNSMMMGRTLMGFEETPNGGNVTYDCSPSGPCIPCTHPEKSDEKYRCSETGYRIRLKCVPINASSKETKSKKAQKDRSALESTNTGVEHDIEIYASSAKQRRLLDDSSKSSGGPQVYMTYRSCIPAVNEERLSVLGFEVIMLALLLSSGSFIFFKRKRSAAVPGSGPVRLPTSSRF